MPARLVPSRLQYFATRCSCRIAAPLYDLIEVRLSCAVVGRNGDVRLREPVDVGGGSHLSALGGDFYGDPNSPICKAADPIVQFESNFHQLLTLGPGEVPAIWAAANKYEFSPIEARSRLNYNPSGVYASMPTTGTAVTIPIPGYGNLPIPHLVSDEDRAFDEATGGSLLYNGRYLNLAQSNFDHFGVDALTAYQAGHTWAQAQAASATKETNGFRRDRLLRQAYAINAFADHFLTDLFAAGHMRTPRRALDDSATTMPKVLPGLLSKVMHDEDNKFGIWVENSMGDVWVAYGDGRYRDPPNAANRRIMRLAILASMNDVWNAYKNPGKPPLQSRARLYSQSGHRDYASWHRSGAPR